MVRPPEQRLLTEANADTVTAAHATTPGSALGTALNATILDQTTQKMVQGGRFPKTERKLVLVTERSWPDRNVDYRLLWAENGGQTLYANGFDNTVRKSTDGGSSFVKRGYQAFGSGGQGTYLKLPTGTMLTMRTSSGALAIFQRSTDDGATWTTVSTAQRSAHYPMGAQSWDVDKTTGYVYYGEYTTGDDQTTLNLYRSTDDGATFAVFYAFPGFASGSADKIRHIHSVQWDHVAGRIVIMTGDSDPAGGMYRVTASGASVEPLLLNRDVPGIPDAARAIGIMPFPDYLCWTGDSTGNPYLMRMKRTEIGKVNPVVERVYRLNSTGWFVCKASDDGTRWVFSASQESSTTRLDKSVHLYAVEDQGATVYEVGALPTSSTGLAALAPLGTPGDHGDVFFLQGHNVEGNPVWKLRLAYGTAPLARPVEPPTVYAIQTRDSGSVAVGAAGSVIFGHARVPALATKLHIYDAGVIGQSGDVGAARVHVRVKGVTPSFYQSANVSEAYTGHTEGGGPLGTYPLTAAQDLEFMLVSAGTSGAYTGTGYVVFGFGR